MTVLLLHEGEEDHKSGENIDSAEQLSDGDPTENHSYMSETDECEIGAAKKRLNFYN